MLSNSQRYNKKPFDTKVISARPYDWVSSILIVPEKDTDARRHCVDMLQTNTAFLRTMHLSGFPLTRAMSRAFDYSSLLLRLNKRAYFLIH